MAQFQCGHKIYTNNDSGPRSTSDLLGIVIHTTENSGRTTAMDVARYQQSPSAAGSYNMLVDKFRNTVRSNDDNFVPWAAGSWQANSRYIHIAVTGEAKYSRETWLGEYLAAIEELAKMVAHTAREYGIPLVRLTVDQLRSGVKGLAGHNECAKAFGGSDHWDPGPNFPYDVVIALATGAAGQPTTEPAPVENQIDSAAAAAPWLGERKNGGERPSADGSGQYADFDSGSVYWSPDTGAVAVPNLIYQAWADRLREQGPLGYPVREHTIIDGQGDVQAFQGGVLYRRYGHPGHVVHGVIGDRWFRDGAEQGRLGWPIADEEDYEGGRLQRFQNANLAWHPSGAVEVQTSNPSPPSDSGRSD